MTEKHIRQLSEETQQRSMSCCQKSSQGVDHTDSTCQLVDQIQSSLGSPSVFLISELKTDHDVGKQSTSKRDKKIQMMIWHAEDL